jgi:small GTP-binding protein
MTIDPNLRPLKVILVGATGVGKTSLINAYFDQPHQTDTPPTVAPAFCATTVTLDGGKEVELHIWDTAGQERFQSIGGMFYRDSDVAFVCFDKPAIGTISDWVGKVRRQVPDCIIFLVATKQDLLSDDEMTELSESRQNLIDEVNAANFLVTSASLGKGVKELFSAAAKCVDQVCAASEPATETVLTAQTAQTNEGCSC